MANPIPSELPDLPSALIRIGLEDLRWIEQETSHEIDMGVFISPMTGQVGVCAVCLAGAVMVRRLGFHIDRKPINMKEKCSKATLMKLYALDAFRQGAIHSGLSDMGLFEKHVWDAGSAFPGGHCSIPRYGQGGFYEALEALAVKLEGIGL